VIRGTWGATAVAGAPPVDCGPPGVTRRRWGATAVAGAVAALVLLFVPARADAHAELVSTEPAASQQLPTAPDQVVLHFSESVSMTDDTIEVLDATGARVAVGQPEHPDGDGAAVAASLSDLDDGVYVVAWRVVSSDSHPVSGAFTFRVGDAGAISVDDQALIADVLGGSQDGDHTLGAAYGVVRFLAFGGLTVLVGSVVFLTWLWPAGADDRRARRVVAGAWSVSVVATVLSIPLQGAYAAGGTLGDVLSTHVVADELGARTGRSWVVRLILLALAAYVVPRLGRFGATAARVVAVAGGLALLATVTLTGHAVSGDLVPLAVVTDLVHLSGVSVWLGGLALLVAAVLWVPGGAGDDGADEVPDDRVAVADRFSQVAFGAVVAIVVSGVVQGWRQVGGYDALTETAYGRLLLVKVLLVAAMLVAAAFSRSWVRQRAGTRSAGVALSPGPGAVAASPGGGGPPPIRDLRWSVAAEVGLAVLVLAVTAMLVNAVPGETASSGGGGGPFDTQVTEDDIVLTLDLDSTSVGSTGVHLYLNTPNGFPVTAEEVTASLTLPEQDLGPIAVPLVDFGQGHWSAESAELPLPGNWELELLVRTSEIDQTRFAVTIPVSS
jgi:copper transport protein